MGLSMLVGDTEFRLSNAVEFNRFLNEISNYGEFPSFLRRSFSEGKFLYSLKSRPNILYSSLVYLSIECKELKKLNLSQRSKDILRQIDLACEKAIEEKKDIELI